MNKSAFWYHHHKSSTDSVTSITGFHDGYIYKIINQYDDTVISLENFKTVPGAVIITDEDAVNDCQRFKATRIREGEEGGEFEVQSVHQDPNGQAQIWEYKQDKKILIQDTAAPGSATASSHPSSHSQASSGNALDLNQLWVAVEKEEGSRIYFIKPVSENVCLTNMGAGQPVGLYAPDNGDLTQHWVLEPLDYLE